MDEKVRESINAHGSKWTWEWSEFQIGRLNRKEESKKDESKNKHQRENELPLLWLLLICGSVGGSRSAFSWCSKTGPRCCCRGGPADKTHTSHTEFLTALKTLFPKVSKRDLITCFNRIWMQCIAKYSHSCIKLRNLLSQIHILKSWVSLKALTNDDVCTC